MPNIEDSSEKEHANVYGMWPHKRCKNRVRRSTRWACSRLPNYVSAVQQFVINSPQAQALQYHPCRQDNQYHPMYIKYISFYSGKVYIYLFSWCTCMTSLTPSPRFSLLFKKYLKKNRGKTALHSHKIPCYLGPQQAPPCLTIPNLNEDHTHHLSKKLNIWLTLGPLSPCCPLSPVNPAAPCLFSIINKRSIIQDVKGLRNMHWLSLISTDWNSRLAITSIWTLSSLLSLIPLFAL